jgi:hypothetical protein
MSNGRGMPSGPATASQTTVRDALSHRHGAGRQVSESGAGAGAHHETGRRCVDQGPVFRLSGCRLMRLAGGNGGVVRRDGRPDPLMEILEAAAARKGALTGEELSRLRWLVGPGSVRYDDFLDAVGREWSPEWDTTPDGPGRVRRKRLGRRVPSCKGMRQRRRWVASPQADMAACPRRDARRRRCTLARDGAPGGARPKSRPEATPRRLSPQRCLTVAGLRDEGARPHVLVRRPGGPLVRRSRPRSATEPTRCDRHEHRRRPGWAWRSFPLPSGGGCGKH